MLQSKIESKINQKKTQARIRNVVRDSNQEVVMTRMKMSKGLGQKLVQKELEQQEEFKETRSDVSKVQIDQLKR